jgi:MFS family permease
MHTTSSSDDLLARRRPTGIPRGALIVLLSATFVSLFGVGIIVPILPVYATELGASGFLLGLMTASFSLASAASQPFIGALSDKRGRKPFIVIGLLVYGLAGLAYVFAGDVWALMGVRAFQGVGAAMIFPIAMAYIGDRTPEQYEGRYMGMYNVAVFAGIGAGPIIGGFFKDTLGMAAGFYAMAAASLLAMVMILAMLQENRDEVQEQERGTMLSALRDMMRNARLQGVFALRLAVQLVSIPTFAFLPLFMTQTVGASGVQVGIVVTVRTLVNATFQPLFGWLGDRHSKVFLSIVASAGMVVVTVLIGFSGTFWQLVALFVLLGLVEAVLWPCLSGLVVEDGRSHGMGYTMSVFNMIINVGIFAGSMLAGAVVDSLGMTAMFVGCAIILACAIPGFIYLTRERRRAVPPMRLVVQK